MPKRSSPSTSWGRGDGASGTRLSSRVRVELDQPAQPSFYTMWGDAARVAGEIRKFAEVGVTHLALAFPSREPEPLTREIDRFVAEVLPLVSYSPEPGAVAVRAVDPRQPGDNRVGSEPSAEEVNELFRAHANTGELEGILRYTDEPLVSSDIVHSSYSSIFDSDLTMANGNLVKVFSWYDNEWGYSCRLVDLVARIGQTLPSPVAA